MLDNIDVLCHSSIKINKEKIIYIDPFKIDKDYEDADLIFITHDHYDHYSEDDIDKVKKLLQDVVNDTPQVLKKEPVFVGITAYKDSCVDYTVRVWTKNAEYWDAYLPMLEKIKRTFDQNNIEIPYNKLDVHLIKD